MKEQRESERREKVEGEISFACEDVEWEKLLCEDLLRTKRVSVLNLYIERHNLTTEKKLAKKSKLDLVSAHIQSSAALRQCIHYQQYKWLQIKCHQLRTKRGLR